MELLVIMMWFLASLSPRVTSTPVINDRPLPWWRAAKECEQEGTKLFVPETEDDVHLLSNTIDDEIFHWIGGLTFLSWKWSCDNTSFYKPVCQSEIHCVTNKTLTGNSAYKCHQYCNPRFGLQGETCCCLGQHSYKCTTTSRPQITCKGNLDDFCGSENFMSVYDMEIGESLIEPSQRCMYAKKVEDRVRLQGDNCLHTRSMAGHKEKRHFVSLLEMYAKKVEGRAWLLGDNCLHRRSMAGYQDNGPGQLCEGDVKVTEKLKDWDTWSAESKLLKVTNNNIEDLTNKMRNFIDDTSTYWIGLRGFLDSRWLFETNMDIPKPEDEGDIDEYCLAVRKSNSSLEYNWNTCSYPLKSVCRKVYSTTTMSTATTTKSPDETSSHTTSIKSSTPLNSTSQSSAVPSTVVSSAMQDVTSTVVSSATQDVTSTVVSSATQDVTSTVASSPATSELSTHAGIEQETASNQGGYTGLYVGIPIGIVLIIGIVVGCIFYRQRRVCFSNRKDDTTTKPETVSAFKSSTASTQTFDCSLDDNSTTTENIVYANLNSFQNNELQSFSKYSFLNVEASGSGSNGACYEVVDGLRDPSKDHKVKATPKVNSVKVTTEGNKVKVTSERHKVNDVCYEDVGDLRDPSKYHKVKDTPKVTTEGHKVKDPAGVFKVKHKTEQHMVRTTPVFDQNTEYEHPYDSARRNVNVFEHTYNHIDKGNDIFQDKTSYANANDNVNTPGIRVGIVSGSANQSLNGREENYDHPYQNQSKDVAVDSNYSNIQFVDTYRE